MAAVTWSPRRRGLTIDVSIEGVLKNPLKALEPALAATPGWGEDAAAAAEVTQMSGAITNLVFRVSSSKAATNSTVIVRVYGSGNELFSRQDEVNIFMLAADLGLGPACLVEFKNGRVEQFIPGASLSAHAIRLPPVSAALAAAMAAFQSQMLVAMLQQRAGEQQQPLAQLRPAIWDRIRQWYAAAKELCAPQVKALGLSNMEEELARVEAAQGARFPSWVAFCHNDAQYGNMLWLPGPGTAGAGVQGAAADADFEDGGSIKLIDYEYSTLNDVAFDMANHWCEWAADYHSEQAHLLDFGRLPSPQQQLHFCRAYVVAMRQLLPPQSAGRAAAAASNGNGAAGASSSLATAIWATAPTSSDGGAEEQAEALALLLREKALAQMPLSHLKWGLWGLVMHATSEVDFDYVEYARQRIEQWHLTKLEWLG